MGLPGKEYQGPYAETGEVGSLLFRRSRFQHHGITGPTCTLKKLHTFAAGLKGHRIFYYARQIAGYIKANTMK